MKIKIIIGIILVLIGCIGADLISTDVYNKPIFLFTHEEVDDKCQGRYTKSKGLFYYYIDYHDKSKKNEVVSHIAKSKCFDIKFANTVNGYELASTLHSNVIDTTTLVMFDGVLYGKSNATIDYSTNTKSIGTIDKLIDSEYMPKLDNETNTKEIHNALVFDKTDESIIIFYNNEYVLFESI